MKPIANDSSSSSLSPDVVLSVRGISKKFCRDLRDSMAYGMKDLARNLIGIRQDTTVLRKNEFWAIADVSFDLRHGETLGIIGQNGSGKSTLLRILDGIFPPDRGEVTFRGRIGGLIALGAGMHPHMTGRENIYLNGVILGMSRAEIDAKMDSIIEFAEIGDFLEAPLATYSSGMRVRLGFAVAIHREPDILLIDEVLSVGDYSFVNKSLRRLHEYRQKAKALIYISHNLEQVRNLCKRVIVLDKGQTVFDGESNEGVMVYQDLCATTTVRMEKRPESPLEGKTALLVNPSVELRLVDFGILDAAGEEVTELRMDEPLTIYCDFEVAGAPRPLFFSVGVLDERKVPIIWVMSNDFDKADFSSVPAGRHRVSATMDQHHLMPGVYYPLIAIRNEATQETYSRFAPGHSFAVRPTGQVLARGFVKVEERWSLQAL